MKNKNLTMQIHKIEIAINNIEIENLYWAFDETYKNLLKTLEPRSKNG